MPRRNRTITDDGLEAENGLTITNLVGNLTSSRICSSWQMSASHQPGRHGNEISSVVEVKFGQDKTFYRGLSASEAGPINNTRGKGWRIYILNIPGELIALVYYTLSIEKCILSR